MIILFRSPFPSAPLSVDMMTSGFGFVRTRGGQRVDYTFAPARLGLWRMFPMFVFVFVSSLRFGIKYEGISVRGEKGASVAARTFTRPPWMCTTVDFALVSRSVYSIPTQRPFVERGCIFSVLFWCVCSFWSRSKQRERKAQPLHR